MSDIQSQNESPEEIAKRIEREINQPLPKMPDVQLPNVDLPKVELPKLDPEIKLPSLGQSPVQPGGYQGGIGYPPIMPPQTNSLAIISLISSILSWVFVPVIGGIVGVVLGIKARNDIKASNGTQTGDGLALAGIIVGGANIAIACIGILCFVGFAVLAAASGSN
jgi:hypothetical protein